MDDKNGTSRRDFLKGVTGAVAFGVSGKLNLLQAAQQESAVSKSKVVVARDPMLRGNGAKVDSGRILNLLDRGMQALYDAQSPLEPWKKLLRPGERVGLKVNTIAGRGLSTNVQLIEAICERLQQAGIKADNIVIWDRTNGELERAGFRLSSSAGKIRCVGTDAVGYEPEPAAFGSVRSRVSKILTRNCDVLINVPLLKDHVEAGVTMALKNMYGVIQNPDHYHGHGCNPYIADLNMLPAIRTKTRITICDATTACYEGGPTFEPEYTWKHNSLLIAHDPVALDYTGWQIIEHKRAEKGLQSLEARGRGPRYLATAADARHRLGTNDPKRIALVEV